MIGSHAWTFVGDAVSVSFIVGAFVVLMFAAERRDRAAARRARRTASAPSHVRRVPR